LLKKEANSLYLGDFRQILFVFRALNTKLKVVR